MGVGGGWEVSLKFTQSRRPGSGRREGAGPRVYKVLTGQAGFLPSPLACLHKNPQAYLYKYIIYINILNQTENVFFTALEIRELRPLGSASVTAVTRLS